MRSPLGTSKFSRKIGLDPARDDPTQLLRICLLNASAELVSFLLAAGADSNGGDARGSPMQSLVTCFEWYLDMEGADSKAMQAIEALAKAGGRWRPEDPDRRRCLRTALAKAYPRKAVEWLCRLMDSGAIEKDVFAELMKTPAMKALLASSNKGAPRLRKFVGL